jgi:large subunit ribosomal protein L4
MEWFWLKNPGKGRSKVQLPLYNLAGEVVRQIEVNDSVFGAQFNEALVHQVMVGMRANARQGNSSTKTRSMVSGSTRKLFRQKGTGEARAGSAKSALRRGGAITFGPHPRDYRQDTPRKMRRLALRCVLSAKAGDGELKVVEGFNFEEAKTKKMVEVLSALGIAKSALVVTQESEPNLVKSARNLPKIDTTNVKVINIIDIMSHQTLLMTEAAVRAAEKQWGISKTEGGD